MTSTPSPFSFPTSSAPAPHATPHPTIVTTANVITNWGNAAPTLPTLSKDGSNIKPHLDSPASALTSLTDINFLLSTLEASAVADRVSGGIHTPRALAHIVPTQMSTPGLSSNSNSTCSSNHNNQARSETTTSARETNTGNRPLNQGGSQDAIELFSGWTPGEKTKSPVSSAVISAITENILSQIDHDIFGDGIEIGQASIGSRTNGNPLTPTMPSSPFEAFASSVAPSATEPSHHSRSCHSDKVGTDRRPRQITPVKAAATSNEQSQRSMTDPLCDLFEPRPIEFMMLVANNGADEGDGMHNFPLWMSADQPPRSTTSPNGPVIHTDMVNNDGAKRSSAHISTAATLSASQQHTIANDEFVPSPPKRARHDPQLATPKRQPDAMDAKLQASCHGKQVMNPPVLELNAAASKYGSNKPNNAAGASLAQAADNFNLQQPKQGPPSPCSPAAASAAAGTMEPRFRGYQEDQWNERYRQLVAFLKVHGHCQIPHRKNEKESLSRWCKRQRYQFKLMQEGRPSTMTLERVEALNRIMFVWDSHGAIWEERIQELREFRQQKGHCSVPSHYPPNQKLATWVKCQRRQYKLFRSGMKSNMTMERAVRLNQLGFVWELRCHPTNPAYIGSSS